MRANRRVSGLERRFRSALWAAGARGYRVQSRLPGRPDVVFPKERIAIFVHGCFWHGCATCSLPRPRQNAQFWAAKLAANTARDAVAVERLRELGWDVIKVWEHEIRQDADRTATAVVGERRRRRYGRRCENLRDV